MSAGDVLGRVVAALDAAGIRHMLAGSFASGVHGAPRTTHDIDIVIDPDRPALESFLSALEDERYYVDRDVARHALRQRGMFNVIDLATGWKIDFIIRKARPFSHEEMARREAAQLHGVQIFVATAEDTIIAKLEWAKAGGSERQLRDVAEILAAQAGRLDVAYLARWIGELGLGAEWDAVRRDE